MFLKNLKQFTMFSLMIIGLVSLLQNWQGLKFF